MDELYENQLLERTRAVLKDDVPAAVLIVDAAKRGQRGIYSTSTNDLIEIQ